MHWRMESLLIKDNWKLAAVSAASAVFIFASGCSLLPQEDAPLAPPLVKPVKQNFTTVTAKLGTIEQSVKGYADLDPYIEKYHQFRDSGGRVKEILVRTGDEVKIGDSLLQLEVEGLDME